MWDYSIQQTIAYIGETRVVREYELNSNVLKINLTFVSLHLKTTVDIQISKIFELPLEKNKTKHPSYA